MGVFNAKCENKECNCCYTVNESPGTKVKCVGCGRQIKIDEGNVLRVNTKPLEQKFGKKR